MHNESITSFTHGRDSSTAGFQCQACGKFAAINSGGPGKAKEYQNSLICECSGKFEREKVLFCPECQSKNLSYDMEFITWRIVLVLNFHDPDQWHSRNRNPLLQGAVQHPSLWFNQPDSPWILDRRAACRQFVWWRWGLETLCLWPVFLSAYVRPHQNYSKVNIQASCPQGLAKHQK